MSFQVPDDSSPPSTPDKSHSFLSDVSTTPAVPPPSATNSFTPQGPPPSTVFGSSQLGSRSKNSPDALFTRSGNMNLNDSIFGSSIGSFNSPARSENVPPKRFGMPKPAFGMSNGRGRFGESPRFGKGTSFISQRSENIEEDVHEGETEQEADDMHAENTYGESTNRLSFLDSDYGDSLPPRPTAALGHHEPIFSSPASAKRPKLDDRRANQSPLRRVKLSTKKDSPMKSVVKNLASRSTPAAVEEPSEMIVQTEDEICRMYDDYGQAEEGDIDLNVTLSEAANNLAAAWKSGTNQTASRHYGTEAAIGPGEHAPNAVKAAFLGSLMLQLHHPPASDNLSSSTGHVAPQSLILARSRTYSPMPMPKVLLDWLDTNHIPQSVNLHALKEIEPNPTASSHFWEIINGGILRGRFLEVADALRSADFNYARSALEDGLPQPGYRGTQLQNIQRCINKLLQVVESCPGSQRGNWDVRGAEWSMYRKHVVNAAADLEEFAEGEDQPVDIPASGSRFQAVNFGLSKTFDQQNVSFAQSARMAESRVPWAIYQNVKSLYRIILGDVEAITSHAQDWVEATIGLTVWWDGEDDGDGPGQVDGFGASIASNKRSYMSKSAAMPTDGDDQRDAYLSRIQQAYSSTTSDAPDTGFRVNPLSSLEVGLASVFEGNTEGVVELLQTWSLCVASAVAEVSSAGGWFDSTEGKMPGFNEDDLMVLSYGQNASLPGSRISKDDVLCAYASGLSGRPSIDNYPGGRSGWEVALGILSRLDDADRMKASVSNLLDKLPLDTSAQMDKVVLLCGELGLEDEGRRVAERYGDATVSKSENYGLVLVCYARAHSRRKVKSVVDLLISYSLVQSRAYPAFGDLDADLRSLTADPKAYLSGLAGVDEEAAGLLQFYFSGYATLRRFYEIRDEAVALKDGQRPHFKPLARRRAAAQALVAVIGSAADSIYGGLYDPERDSAVQVDGLLALLAEALAFVDQPTPILSVSQQFTILSAIEDLESVTPRVYSQCEECFRSTLLEYHSAGPGEQSTSESFALPPSPRAMLKKSVSSLTASSSFSFIGNDMLESARTRSVSREGSGSSSAVLVPRPGDRKDPLQRGWDWRAGLSEDAKGEDILRMLRLGLARGVSYGALG